MTASPCPAFEDPSQLCSTPPPQPRPQRLPDAQALRALIVSYAFPPTGGAGVQRMLKLVKYLPEHGVTPSVLTAANPSVPLYDESLLRDVPQGVAILRARTLEPGYALKRAAWHASAAPRSKDSPSGAKRRVFDAAKELLVPDPQVLWQPAAQARLLRRLLGGTPDHVVLISGPPFSQFLLALTARLRPGTAVVLDYRDEWTTYRASYEMTSRFAAHAGDGLEHLLVRRAHAITTATEAFRCALLSRFPRLSAERVTTIPNGWDADDLPHAMPELRTDRFVVTYAGTVFRLTSARTLLGAIRRLHEREPALAKLLELRFIGRIVDTEASCFEGVEALGVRRLGYVAHERVLPELAASHLVLCLLDDVPGAERIYPAKIFEIMRLGRPCLTLAPPGALAELVTRHRAGEVVPPRHEAAIAEALARRLREFRDGVYDARARPVAIDQYDRRALAGRFAEVMRIARCSARGE